MSNILKKIYYKRKKGDATLQEVHDLYFLAKEKYLAVQVQEVKKTKEASKLVLTIFFWLVE